MYADNEDRPTDAVAQSDAAVENGGRRSQSPQHAANT